MRVGGRPLVATSAVLLSSTAVSGRDAETASSRVYLRSGDWVLVGDLVVPATAEPAPAVLMLNQAAGDRSAYAELAGYLAARGIASLSLDFRGHGESTNLGRFVPGELPHDPKIWDAESDVIAAEEFLRSDSRIDGERLGVVDASCSGEEAAEAGRRHGHLAAYVLLSPGSLSDSSIRSIDESGVPWLLISARDDSFLVDVGAAVRAGSRTVEVETVPGSSHATDMLADHASL